MQEIKCLKIELKWNENKHGSEAEGIAGDSSVRCTAIYALTDAEGVCTYVYVES